MLCIAKYQSSLRSNFIFSLVKTARITTRKMKMYNTLYLAGNEVCKTDEKNLVRFDFDI